MTRALEGVVSLCLGEAGRVVWMDRSDAAAFTQGQKVFLPKPQGADPREMDLLLAITLREVAKVQFTADKVLEQGRVLPYAAAIEEARVKKEFSREYRGAPNIFDAAMQVAVEMVADNAEQMPTEALNQLAVWAAAHDGLLGTETSRRMASLAATVAQTVGDAEHLPGALDVARNAYRVKDTAGALQVGTEIADMLQPAEDEPPSPPPQGDEQQGQQEPGDQDKGEGNTSANAADDGPQAGQSGGAEPGPSSRSDDQSPSGGEGSAGDGGASQAPCTDPLSDALARLNGHDGAKDVSSTPEEFLDSEVEPAEVPQGLADALQDENCNAASLLDALGEKKPSGDSSAGGLSMEVKHGEPNLLAPVPARLVTVLLQGLQDRRRRPFSRGMSGQKVSSTHAWRLRTLGDPRVFRRRSPASGIDAAVSILLDTSESMEAVGMPQAVDAAMALVVALLRISGVQVSLDTFPGDGDVIREVLAFRQNWREAQERLQTIRADGGTPTGSAMARRLASLRACRADKKVMVIITDGKPHPVEVPLTRLKVAEAAANGVVVVAIGINVDVSALFPVSVTVSSVDELPHQLERVFKSKVLDALAA